MIKLVLFDLDGTLLPFDRHTFEKRYFNLIADTFKDDKNCNLIVNTIMESVKEMTLNISEKTNEEVFIDYFNKKLTDSTFNQYEFIFNKMYMDDFPVLKNICDFEPKAKVLVDFVKSKKVKVVCATNPLFPRICTQQRLDWAGLKFDDFDFVTTYENSVSAKPNPYFFECLLRRYNVKPEETILIGNDAIEDGVALSLGIKVVLIDRCLENKDKVNEGMFVGNIDQVQQYLNEVL